MAQKRTDYSKFAQWDGTVQVLMLWASIALHLVIGSNLGLFGRLDPIKVKPAGGTVRVVDLTPAEQTRVPEAAKSKPLPIAQTPVNPEIATRTPVNSNNSSRAGASNFVPPKVRSPQLPPSSQIPQPPTVRQPNPVPSTPAVNTAPNGADIPIPRPPRSPKQDSDGNNPSESDFPPNGGRRRPKAPKGDERVESSFDQTPTPSPTQPSTPINSPTPTPTPDQETTINDRPEDKRRVQDAINGIRNKGNNLIEVKVPRDLQKTSSCRIYKKIDMTWPFDENGNLDLSTFGGDNNFTKEEILPDGKINSAQKLQVISVAKAAHARLTVPQKKELINKYKKNADNLTYYSFKIPVC